MQVKVKRDCTGFLGGKLRKEGETFEVSEDQFSENWMVKLEEKAKATLKKQSKQSD